MLNKNAVTKSYNKMIKQQQHQLDVMTNLGKSRDLKVEKIDRKYQAKIDNIIRKQKETALQVEIAQRYVTDISISCNNAPVVNKTIKKRDD